MTGEMASRQRDAARDAFTRADNELALLRAEIGEMRGENQRLKDELAEARAMLAAVGFTHTPGGAA